MRYSLFHNIDKRRDADNIWGEYRPGDRLAPYYAGDIRVDGYDYVGVAHDLFAKHNRDSRPCGRLGPSLSIGDVIVLDDGRCALAVALEGFDEVHPSTLVVLPKTYLQWLDDERKERARG